MKYYILFLIVLFSTLTYSNPKYDFKNTDFAPFPLSAGSVSLIEGVWRGKMISIHIKDSGRVFNSKPLLKVEVMDHRFNKTKRGIMYYSQNPDQYKLYIYMAQKSIPIDLGIFVFSSSYASEFGMKCKSGGTLLKIEFEIDNVLEDVLLTKEKCS